MKREKLQQLLHLSAGIITLVYGFDTFEAADFSSAAYYLSLAIIFLVVAGSHKWIVQKFMNADVAFYLIEAATIISSGWHYNSKGHPYLFYILAVVGTFYFIFSIINLFSEEKPRHHSRRRKRMRHSSLFDEKKPDNNNKNLQ